MKVLIIEDETAAARRLAKLITEIDPNIEVVEQLDSIEGSVLWFEQHPMPDLIFMDIHLADGSSFEIFNHLKIEKPIVFTTAYDEYALQAFKVNAIDYLLKPLKKTELEQAIAKYKSLQKPTVEMNYQALANTLQTDKYNTRFLIRFGQNIKVVEFRDAAYFYTEDKITFIVTKEGKRYPVEPSLEKLDEMADPRAFFRINRQFIVNIESIKEMYAYSKSRVKLKLDPPTDKETIVSTERSPVFKKWLVGKEGE
ncbi:MAG: LytTR family DNA-binding domain-containing protein [Saprospiraceae bacterium]|jgi:two-component system LytT family response regulator|nr:LytTR family DNA-binding domain-containing protein [Saprospiraceae bacterium]